MRQQMPRSGLSDLSRDALEKVSEDRRKIIEQLLKYGCPLNEQDAQSFRLRDSELVERIAALGPRAVLAISARMGDDYRRTGHWAMAKKSLLKMGSAAVEPLLPLMDSRDRYLRANVAYVLYQIPDRRAKDALQRAVSDEFESVRHWAIQGLVKLGPEVVGQHELITILIDRLQDGVCLRESIQGLKQYGDETAIEHLRIIERFYVNRGKGDLRYSARQAINSILRRAGKPVVEVSREHYSDKRPSHDELFQTAAHCPNAVIRSSAIAWLGRYRDDRTALFFVQRLNLEKNPMLLRQLARSLGILTLPPRDASGSVVSAPVVQEAFDALVLMAEMNTPEQEGAAVDAARTVIHAARRRQIHLNNIDRYKRIIRQGLRSNVEGIRIACYSGCTAIAMFPPETGDDWTPTEREEMQQHLTPLLDLPNPEIRLIECLGYISDERLTLRLTELLGHDDSAVRRFAAYALGRIGDPQALAALRHLAETDPHRYENGVYGVREAARRAIDQICEVQPVESGGETVTSQKGI